MHNSHKGDYDKEENLEGEIHHYTEQLKCQKFHESRPLNQISNIGYKPNGISSNYSRIIPKKPIHDFERLYTENMQLKEKVTSLENYNISVKTRLSIAEKQKEHLLLQMQKSSNYSALKDRKPSQQGLHKTSDSKLTQDCNRRILHAYKDEVEKLKTENARLKKVVKYTQIQELEAQNNQLQNQLKRLKECIEHLINNTQYNEYQRKIAEIGKQIQGERDLARSANYQLKKKNEQIQEMKGKIKSMTAKMAEMQRKHNRNSSNFKGQMCRTKEGSAFAVEQKKEAVKFKQNCVNCTNYLETIKRLSSVQAENEETIKKKCSEVSRMSEKMRKLSQELNHANVQLQRLKKNEQQKKPPKNIKIEQESLRFVEKGSSQSNRLETQRDSDFNENEENSTDQVDMIDVDLGNRPSSSQIMQYLKENDSKRKIYADEALNEYEDDFNNDVSQQELVLQKQKSLKQKKEQTKQQAHNQAKASKNLKETIRYRLIGHRYTFHDFKRDINRSGHKQFNIQDLLDMLTGEPFLLHEKHLEMVLFHCFGKKQFTEDDFLRVDKFLKVMKPYFGQIQLIPEKEEQLLSQQIQRKIKNNETQIQKQMDERAKGKQVSKRDFVSILQSVAMLNQDEVEHALAVASVVSADIAHIFYKEFLDGMQASS